MSMISTGDSAPDFTLPATQGGEFTLSKQDGVGTVLFFYPKDNTPGCTKEAIGFTAHLAEFEKLGISVVGMSPDSLKKHENFTAKQNLEVNLISDEELSILQAYGVWTEKKMYGKSYMGVERTTLLIDAKGKVFHAWHKVKVPRHVEEVLEKAREMAA